VAGLGVGAVSGALALDKRSGLDAACPDGNCPPALHGDVDSFDTLRLLSNVGFIAGGVLAGAGMLLLITAPSAPEPSTAGRLPRLRVGPGGVSLEGSF
jgi:hypothetical protein